MRLGLLHVAPVAPQNAQLVGAHQLREDDQVLEVLGAKMST